MRVVDLRTLEERLREFVALAASGETVRILQGGLVLAEIRPPGGAPFSSSSIEALASCGLLSLPLEARGIVPPSKPAIATDQLLDDLRSDRESK